MKYLTALLLLASLTSLNAWDELCQKELDGVMELYFEAQQYKEQEILLGARATFEKVANRGMEISEKCGAYASAIEQEVLHNYTLQAELQARELDDLIFVKSL